MINQIKHNSPSNVLSSFNPIASLKPKTRKVVNERFILPILESFFSDKGGISNFSELDPDKLITEIEFVSVENFVKTYIYKEIINDISKPNDKIEFKPKFVITFDSDLTNFKRDKTIYPYNAILNIDAPDFNRIKYGVIRLGDAPILYYIFVDLQKLIKFIKTLPEESPVIETNKIQETEEEKRNRLFDNVIIEKQRQLRSSNQTQQIEIEQEIKRLEQVRQTNLEGQSGKLRINLAWNTTDDLDLHIETPNGEISYNRKAVENQGVIGILDVDKNAGDELVSNPQENISFDGMPIGLHKVYVNLYRIRERSEVPFTVTIIPENGEGRIFDKKVNSFKRNKYIVSFEYVNGELVFEEYT